MIEILVKGLTENSLNGLQPQVCCYDREGADGAKSAKAGTLQGASAAVNSFGALHTAYARWFKRALDLVLSSILLLLLLPLLLAVAVLIKLTSRGPVLFVQKRVGLGETEFSLYKFRSMRTDQKAREIQAQAEALAATGVLLKLDKDPRVTPIGAFIRKTSIDELPQLVNVFLGHMSLVGPRPLVEFMFREYQPEKKLRCLVRPGLTGPWQISARHDCLSLAPMWPYDFRYLHEVSFWTDFRILLGTVPAVLFCQGSK